MYVALTFIYSYATLGATFIHTVHVSLVKTLNYVVIYLLINQLHQLINELMQLLVFNISLP